MNQHIIIIDIYIIIITIIVIHDHKDYYDNIIFTIFIIISYRYYFAVIIVYSPKNYEMKGGCMYSPAFFVQKHSQKEAPISLELVAGNMLWILACLNIFDILGMIIHGNIPLISY